MLPTGIFVKAELDELISSLPDRLISRGPSYVAIEREPREPQTEEWSHLELSQWSDEWCFIEIAGPEELTSLVIQSVVKHKPVMAEVLSCHYRPHAGECRYAYFREGTPLETFEVRGPSMEAVSFTSELRRVPLQALLRSSDFMIESLGNLGIQGGSRPAVDRGKVRFYIRLSNKKTFWQTLLGAAWSK
jgi:hypothetical protein